jgi:predicted porin
MKKIAVATLLAATVLVATAQVSVTGRISEFVDNKKVGAVSTTGLVSSVSKIVFSATEDLGNGLQARAVLDTSLAASDPVAGADTKLGDRQSTVGLVNKLGSVDLGRNLHSHFSTILSNDVFSVLYGTIAGDVHSLRGLRLSNGTFFTVTPVKDVTATYARTQTTTGTEATSYSAGASLFGVNAVVSQYEQGAEKSTLYAANTRLGNTQLVYTRSIDKGLVAKTGDLIGAKHEFGPVTAKASYGRTNTNVKAYALGADYNFSKRTAAGVAYRNVNVVGTTNDVKQIGLGLTHSF